ncbi:MAG: beta-lactamase family protein [Balneolaceae bacterium]|nr:beta-lactamase family protein [Balneolaceae bacterium]
MYPFRILILLSFLFSFGPSVKAQSEPRPALLKNKLSTYLNIIHQKKGFHGEVLVAKGTDIIFQRSVGMASVEHNLKLINGKKYRIASISKTFTGTLAAIAERQKKISFDDKAVRYIKNLPDTFEEITIYQLLTHTSGLPHNEGIEDYWTIKSKLQLTHDQIMNEINKLSLIAPPGSKMHYSSIGYYLLATILENVYQQDLKQVLHNELFLPAGMNTTGVANSLHIVPGLVPGYHLVSDDSVVTPPYRNYSMLKGAGDMYSTAEDLLKWNLQLMSGDLISKQTIKAIFTSHPLVDKKGRRYGLGWFIRQEKPLKYYHGGGTWGYSSHTSYYPEERLSIILLSNRSTLPVESIATDLEYILFGKPFTMPKRERSIASGLNDLSLYTGNYESPSGRMKLSIIKKNGQLFARLAANPPFRIYPKGNHLFFGKKVEIELSFKIKDGEISGLTGERMGRKFQFRKL